MIFLEFLFYSNDFSSIADPADSQDISRVRLMILSRDWLSLGAIPIDDPTGSGDANGKQIGLPICHR
jgi:hypothetical protein